jgi:opacity protein-like surface antigen
MRAILICAASACLLSTAALADDSVLASRFGNTTIATDVSGAQSRLYYNADHTFTAKVGPQAMTIKGTWKIDGGNVCLTYEGATNLPANMPNPTCLPVSAHNVGDTWTTGDGAMKRTVTIVKGIQ